MSKLYVGNVPFSATDEELAELFGQYGALSEAKMITDRETGRPRGFAFVTFETPEAAQDAQQALDGRDFQGRPLRVSEARTARR